MFWIKLEIIYQITRLCLWVIQKINPSKDGSLATELRDIADLYDP